MQYHTRDNHSLRYPYKERENNSMSFILNPSHHPSCSTLHSLAFFMNRQIFSTPRSIYAVISRCCNCKEKECLLREQVDSTRELEAREKDKQLPLGSKDQKAPCNLPNSIPTTVHLELFVQTSRLEQVSASIPSF
jgi:hypothetical protein